MTPFYTSCVLPAGTQLGPYRIASVIGAGGMGEVYRATDTRLGRDVHITVKARSRQGPGRLTITT